MNRIQVLFGKTRKEGPEFGCLECQSSCQSACKTSCTIGNQNCARQETESLKQAGKNNQTSVNAG